MAEPDAGKIYLVDAGVHNSEVRDGQAVSLLRYEDCKCGRESAIRVEMQLLVLDEAVARSTVLRGKEDARVYGERV